MDDNKVFTGKGTPYSSNKKKRTKMSKEQYDILKVEFIKDIFPPLEKRIMLSKMLKLPPKTIQIWFQNQRQRAKIIEEEFKADILRDVYRTKTIETIPDSLIPLEILGSISILELDVVEWKRQQNEKI